MQVGLDYLIVIESLGVVLGFAGDALDFQTGRYLLEEVSKEHSIPTEREHSVNQFLFGESLLEDPYAFQPLDDFEFLVPSEVSFVNRGTVGPVGFVSPEWLFVFGGTLVQRLSSG